MENFLSFMAVIRFCTRESVNIDFKDRKTCWKKFLYDYDFFETNRFFAVMKKEKKKRNKKKGRKGFVVV